MKKRLLPLLLALALLLPSVPARADGDSMGNFVRSRYYAAQFSDLRKDSVFYDNVSALFEYGLSNGRADGSYGLQDPMTIGEICIFAGRIRSIYRTGDPEAGPKKYIIPDAPLAAGYLAYLQAEGVVGSEIGIRDRKDAAGSTPRWEVAHLLANVLPGKELEPINQDAVETGHRNNGYIPDVEYATPYESDILTLYEAGISAGSDEMGSFRPEEAITRGAAAAMLTRLVDPDLRITLDWDLSETPAPVETPVQTPAVQTPVQTPAETPRESAAPPAALPAITYGDLVPRSAYLPAPSTQEELAQDIRWMLSSNYNQLTLHYGSRLSDYEINGLMEDALEILHSYCEQSYNCVSCTYTAFGDVTMTFSSGYMDSALLARYRQEALDTALQVRQRLWDQGKLRGTMTETEKARVYYTWICENCVYDTYASGDSISHTPYGLFARGTAVCDGYTGAYNLLLLLEGIDCMGLANAEHIWTVAKLDGKTVHIDTTWGDPGYYIDYSYFAMTPEQSWRVHSW